jgi:hypothetical protein
MVIGDFDLFRPSVAPDEANTPLIVDPDAVLPSAIPFQGLKVVARGRPQIA